MVPNKQLKTYWTAFLPGIDRLSLDDIVFHLNARDVDIQLCSASFGGASKQLSCDRWALMVLVLDSQNLQRTFVSREYFIWQAVC